jgi:hypothetical protein
VIGYRSSRGSAVRRHVRWGRVLPVSIPLIIVFLLVENQKNRSGAENFRHQFSCEPLREPLTDAPAPLRKKKHVQRFRKGRITGCQSRPTADGYNFMPHRARAGRQPNFGMPLRVLDVEAARALEWKARRDSVLPSMMPAPLDGPPPRLAAVHQRDGKSALGEVETPRHRRYRRRAPGSRRLSPSAPTRR